MKAHIYCRVSKANNSKGGTNINIQIDDCVDYCKANKIDNIIVHEQEQSSRKGTNIPTLRHIMDSMDSGDLLVIHSADRLSRYALEGIQFLTDLYAKGCKIISVAENITYDEGKYYDRFSFRNIMNHAELESDRLSTRISRVKRSNKIVDSILFPSNSNSNSNSNPNSNPDSKSRSMSASMSTRNRKISSTRFQCKQKKQNKRIQRETMDLKQLLRSLKPDDMSDIHNHMKIEGIATRSMIGNKDRSENLNDLDDVIDEVKEEHIKISDTPYVNKMKRNYFLRNIIEKYNENM
jgi:hypothetical protein